MIRIPLEEVPIPQSSEKGVKALIRIMVQNQHSEFSSMIFLVDSGSNITTIPVQRAEELGLIMPTRVLSMETQTAVGNVVQRRRPGRFQVRIPGFNGYTFDWPCHFVEHEGTSPPRCALGLAGVLNDLRLTFDGTYSLDARYGFIQLERLSTQQESHYDQTASDAVAVIAIVARRVVRRAAPWAFTPGGVPPSVPPSRTAIVPEGKRLLRNKGAVRKG